MSLFKYTKIVRNRLVGNILTVVVMLAALMTVIFEPEWISSALRHTEMEVLAMLLALAAGVATLKQYHTDSTSVMRLIIGTGLVGTSLLDGFHMVATSVLGLSYIPTDIKSLIPWSWTVPRLFLAVAMVLTIASWQRSKKLIDCHGVNALLVYTSTLVMVIFCCLYLALIPLPAAYFPQQWIHRPEEILPGIIFVIALYGFLKKGGWRSDDFEYWLVVSIVVNIAVQLLIMPFSNQLFDVWFDVAHGLKIYSYLCVFVGVMSTMNQYANIKTTQGECDKNNYYPKDKYDSARLRVSHVLKTSYQSLYPGIVGMRLLWLISFLGIFIIGSMIISQQMTETYERKTSMMRALNALAIAKKQAVHEKLNDYRIIHRGIGSSQIRNMLAESQRQSYGSDQYNQSIERMTKILNDVVESEDFIRNVTLHNLDGKEVVSVGELWLADVGAETITIPQTQVVSDMRSVDDGTLIQVKGPLYYQDKLIGGMQIWVDAYSISAALGGAKALGDSADASLVYRRVDGKIAVLRSPDSMPNIEPIKKDVKITLDNFPMLRALNGEEGSYETGMIDYDGEPVLAVTRYLPEVRFGLVVKITNAEVDKAISANMRQSLLLGGIVLAISLLMGWVSALLMLSPLHRITQYARNFSADVNQFNLKNRLKIQTNDEFGVLAKTLSQAVNDIGLKSKSVTSLKKRMGAVLDTMNDSVFVIDSLGIISYCNHAVEATFGYKPDELINHNVSVLMPEPIRSQHDGYLRDHMITGKSNIIGQGRDLMALHKKGHQMPVRLEVSRIEIDGEMVFTGILRDLSEAMHFETLLEKQNRELTAANEELQQFAYVASHDLKSPLRAIDNLAEWIIDDLKDTRIPDVVVHNISRLQERARFMEKMIKELLAFSSAGRYAYPSETVEVNKLISQIVFELALPDEMRVVIDDDLPIFDSPKPPLELVLRNLISNAVKHHDKDCGVIRISAQDNGDDYTFSVLDDGPGIDPLYHKKVFQIFQTLKPKAATNSTGMGLALVKRVVEGYGGNVELLSKADERGCLIKFGWPKHWDGKINSIVSKNINLSDKQDAA